MNIFKKIFLVFVSLNIVIYLLFSVFNLNIIQVRMKGSKDSGIKIYYSKNDDGFSEDYSVSKQYRVEKNLKKKIFFI
ncbi:MAG TPA: hypothetical protein DG753_03980, partial [Clostridium sp.]|nr:hypothetical protein [Clostridium sp.]